MRIEDYIIPENVIPIIRNKQVLEDLPKNNIFVLKRIWLYYSVLKSPCRLKREWD